MFARAPNHAERAEETATLRDSRLPVVPPNLTTLSGLHRRAEFSAARDVICRRSDAPCPRRQPTDAVRPPPPLPSSETFIAVRCSRYPRNDRLREVLPRTSLDLPYSFSCCPYSQAGQPTDAALVCVLSAAFSGATCWCSN